MSSLQTQLSKDTMIGRAMRPDSNNGPVAERVSPPGPTALIVDDDDVSALALSALLERGGLSTLAASSGPAALETLDARTDVGVVLMDIMMPVMDGYEAMAEIRKRPAYLNIPIIAVTGKDRDGERERCIAAGASDYVAKPIDTPGLLSALSGWLPAFGPMQGLRA